MLHICGAKTLVYKELNMLPQNTSLLRLFKQATVYSRLFAYSLLAPERGPLETDGLLCQVYLFWNIGPLAKYVYII